MYCLCYWCSAFGSKYCIERTALNCKIRYREWRFHKYLHHCISDKLGRYQGCQWPSFLCRQARKNYSIFQKTSNTISTIPVLLNCKCLWMHPDGARSIYQRNKNFTSLRHIDPSWHADPLMTEPHAVLYCVAIQTCDLYLHMHILEWHEEHISGNVRQMSTNQCHIPCISSNLDW